MGGVLHAAVRGTVGGWRAGGGGGRGPVARAAAGTRLMRVAVTGAGGRLGRAVVAALDDAPFTGPSGAVGWTRSEFDLDAPDSIADLIARVRPDTVIHCAAWTDVDGCARDPDL